MFKEKIKNLNTITVLSLVVACFVQQNIALAKMPEWGFYGHQLINRNAIFLLPEEMFGFFKMNVDYLVKNSTKPDMRRYIQPDEGARHYIDLDVYHEKCDSIPMKWADAVDLWTKDSLLMNGIVPWWVEKMRWKLTHAFETKNKKLILKYASEMGHYIADAHVPLHSCSNYNGQLTNQEGIHSLWESNLVESYAYEYDFILSEAQYVDNTLQEIWNTVYDSHQCLDSVFLFEQTATQMVGEHKKYAYRVRNRINVKTYSDEYASTYHRLLDGQVERRMNCAVQCVANFWFTAWVDAGQPDLSTLIDVEMDFHEKDSAQWTPNRHHEFK